MAFKIELKNKLYIENITFEIFKTFETFTFDFLTYVPSVQVSIFLFFLVSRDQIIKYRLCILYFIAPLSTMYFHYYCL